MWSVCHPYKFNCDYKQNFAIFFHHGEMGNGLFAIVQKVTSERISCHFCLLVHHELECHALPPKLQKAKVKSSSLKLLAFIWFHYCYSDWKTSPFSLEIFSKVHDSVCSESWVNVDVKWAPRPEYLSVLLTWIFSCQGRDRALFDVPQTAGQRCSLANSQTGSVNRTPLRPTGPHWHQIPSTPSSRLLHGF